MKLLASLSVIFLLAGCSEANISSQVRESGVSGSNMLTRCANFTTGDDEDTNEVLKQYDGWKMIYVSEYTTDNMNNSESVMCFEKPAL